MADVIPVDPPAHDLTVRLKTSKPSMIPLGLPGWDQSNLTTLTEREGGQPEQNESDRQGYALLHTPFTQLYPHSHT